MNIPLSLSSPPLLPLFLLLLPSPLALSLLPSTAPLSLPQLQVRGLQSCRAIFLYCHGNSGNAHFIHALGPEVVELVEAGVRGGVKDAGVIVEAMQVLETLLDLTADTNSE